MRNLTGKGQAIPQHVSMWSGRTKVGSMQSVLTVLGTKFYFRPAYEQIAAMAHLRAPAW